MEKAHYHITALRLNVGEESVNSVALKIYKSEGTNAKLGLFNTLDTDCICAAD